MTHHLRPFLISLVFGLTAGAAGCSKDKSTDPVEKLFADYEAAKDRLCACNDKDCTTKLKDEADAIERSAKDILPHPTQAQKDRFKPLENAVNDCARKYGE